MTPTLEVSEKRTRELTVQNKMGIHARPAAMVVRISNKFPDVDLQVGKDDEWVNGKSIMGLMMLAAGSGSKVTCRTIGPNGEKLLDDLEALFARKFDEA
ncbi:MAG: HPr family phosphocarrier protein [Puniceicoccales bacterium]|nr:HPr family phosphocarrier protein [Puniceicoccales bacterium]